MRGLTVILVEPSTVRFRAGLELVAAAAALGGRARLFLHGSAVTLLASDEPLLGEALALGVKLHACQTGLAAAGIELASVAIPVAAVGPLAILQTLGEDRLTTL